MFVKLYSTPERKRPLGRPTRKWVDNINLFKPVILQYLHLIIGAVYGLVPY